MIGCVLQLQNMGYPQKRLLFDNVSMDWNLSHDDGSTDFSDDETIIDERVRNALHFSGG